MKIKYPIFLGLFHLTCFNFFLFLIFSNQKLFYLIIIFLIIINLSTYFAMSIKFKKQVLFLLKFSSISFISFVVFLSFLLYLVNFPKINNLEKYISSLNDFFIMLRVGEHYDTISYIVKLLLIYNIFAIIPSFIVLSEEVKKNKRKNTKKGMKIR